MKKNFGERESTYILPILSGQKGITPTQNLQGEKEAYKAGSKKVRDKVKKNILSHQIKTLSF